MEQDMSARKKQIKSMTEVCSMDEKAFSKYFKAFGDRTRLRIIALLSDKDMSVNEIVKGALAGILNEENNFGLCLS